MSASSRTQQRPEGRGSSSGATHLNRFGGVSREDYYAPALCGPSTIGALASAPESQRAVLAVLELLEPDDYGIYLSGFIRAGMQAYQNYWRYADICTACWSAARLIKPRNYLEIGVRRGRSMSMVAMAAPECDMIGFDMWPADYAGMHNPGKAFVAAEVAKTGHAGSLEFVDGNSHVTLVEYFSQNPDAHFDLATVDGDHTEEGAAQDLAELLPRISVGGVVVFDDIAHPKHPGLASVWRRAMAAHENFRDWTFDELGFGVALAMRMK